MFDSFKNAGFVVLRISRHNMFGFPVEWAHLDLMAQIRDRLWSLCLILGIIRRWLLVCGWWLATTTPHGDGLFIVRMRFRRCCWGRIVGRQEHITLVSLFENSFASVAINICVDCVSLVHYTRRQRLNVGHRLWASSIMRNEGYQQYKELTFGQVNYYCLNIG